MDTRPRFVVTSVTGYTEWQFGGKPGTRFQVLDRPYCYQLVLQTESVHVAERLANLLNRGNWNVADAYFAKVMSDRENGRRYRKRRPW